MQTESQQFVEPVVEIAPGFNPDAVAPLEPWADQDGHTVQITTDLSTGLVSMELTNASPGGPVEIGRLDEIGDGTLSILEAGKPLATLRCKGVSNRWLNITNPMSPNPTPWGTFMFKRYFFAIILNAADPSC